MNLYKACRAVACEHSPVDVGYPVGFVNHPRKACERSNRVEEPVHPGVESREKGGDDKSESCMS